MNKRNKVLLWALLTFIGICGISWNVIGFNAKRDNEILRRTVAQRLEIDANLPWNDIRSYYDCDYVPEGTHIEDMLSRMARVDSYIIKPPGIRVAFQGTIPTIDFSQMLTFVVRYETYESFNRLYGIRKDGIITSPSTLPVGLDSYSEEIICP